MFSEEILTLEKTLDNISAQRIQLEIQKNSLQYRLDDHLLKTKSDLEKTLQEIATSDLSSSEVNSRAIANMEDYLQQIETRLSSSKLETTVVEERIEELSLELAKIEAALNKQKCQLQKQQLLLDTQKEEVLFY